jgi:dolichol-phosphate mannosyltransferase
MPVDEAAVADTAIEPPRLRGQERARAALRTPANWAQLVRFGTVGASGYVINLAVFAAAVHGASLNKGIAATAAFVVALSNNFVWNRLWTFRAGEGHAGFQAARFCVVSLAAFAFNLVVLYVLVDGLGVPDVPAQAIAIASATPLNFIGNKLWSFKA